MNEDNSIIHLRQPDEIDDPLTALLRSGARRLLEQGHCHVFIGQGATVKLMCLYRAPWGIVNLLGGRRGLDELACEQGCCGSCGGLDAADVVLRLEGAGPLGPVIGCGHEVAGQEEEVVDLVVGG
jgi:hypothetical protein